MYCLLIQSKASKGTGGHVITREGTWFVVGKDLPDNYVPGVGNSCSEESSTFPASTKIFETETEARKFAESWGGHPWWVTPNGVYRIREVDAITKPKIIGYKRKG